MPPIAAPREGGFAAVCNEDSVVARVPWRRESSNRAPLLWYLLHDPRGVLTYGITTADTIAPESPRIGDL